MKALAVAGAMLLALVAIGCPEDTFLCEFVADCVAHGDSCPSGQELFCNYDLGGICDCAEGSGGTGGSGGAGGTGGTAGTGTGCTLDVTCNPFEVYDCDTPCRAFCGSSGTEAYGTCPVDRCECHCTNEQCP